MLLIIQGYSSSYSLWAYTQKNKTEYIKAVAYKNINQRFLRLAKLRFLEEVQLGNNLHRRIDYKLTMKGLEQLISYLSTHPEKTQDVIKYIDKFNLDKLVFGDLLVSKFIPILTLIDQHQSVIGKRLVLPSTLLSRIQMEPSQQQQNIDKILAKDYEILQDKLKTANIMITLENDIIRFSTHIDNPLNSKEMARFTDQTIEKIKKKLPKTLQNIRYIEKHIFEVDQIVAKRPTFKPKESITEPIASASTKPQKRKH